MALTLRRGRRSGLQEVECLGAKGVHSADEVGVVRAEALDIGDVHAWDDLQVDCCGWRAIAKADQLSVFEDDLEAVRRDVAKGALGGLTLSTARRPAGESESVSCKGADPLRRPKQLPKRELIPMLRSSAAVCSESMLEGGEEKQAAALRVQRRRQLSGGSSTRARGATKPR